MFFIECASESINELAEIEEMVEQEEGENNGGPITYQANVKSIIDSKCLNCHSSPVQNGAPFSLTTYAQVKLRAEGGALFTAISMPSGSAAIMPPSGRMPQSTIDVIEQWIDGGLLEN